LIIKRLKKIINKRLIALNIDSDRTGRIDFAYVGNGGSIEMSLTSDPYIPRVPSFKSFFHFFVNPLNSPQSVISTVGITPGDCWAMNGTHGFLTIKLRDPIIPSAVTYEHIHKNILLDYKSTPHKFTVYGMNELRDIKTLLGSFEYNNNESTVQTFDFNSTKTYRYIQFEITENYGHPNFTCLYRFRVHSEHKPDMLH